MAEPQSHAAPKCQGLVVSEIEFLYPFSCSLLDPSLWPVTSEGLPAERTYNGSCIIYKRDFLPTAKLIKTKLFVFIWTFGSGWIEPTQLIPWNMQGAVAVSSQPIHLAVTFPTRVECLFSACKNDFQKLWFQKQNGSAWGPLEKTLLC